MTETKVVRISALVDEAVTCCLYTGIPFLESTDNKERPMYFVEKNNDAIILKDLFNRVQEDFIITHCCPSSIQDEMSGGAYKPDALTDFFDEVR